MKKHFSIPIEVVPSEEQVVFLGIKQLSIMNDPKPFKPPEMVIEYDEFNNRVQLQGKIKIKHVAPLDLRIKGAKQILEKLKELKCTNIEQ